MKFVYLIFLILLSLQTIAQVDTSAQWIELKDAYEDNYDNYFRYAKITINNKAFNTLSDLDATCRDLLHKEIQRLRQSVHIKSEHSNVPNKERVNRKLRDAIDSLVNEIILPNNDLQRVIQTINELPDAEESVRSYLYLYEHYRVIGNNNALEEILGKLFHELAIREKNNNATFEIARCYELLGDYWFKFDVVVGARAFLTSYGEAIRLKDISSKARLETKLAKLYSGRSMPEYDFKSAYHFERASNLYGQIGNSTDAFTNSIRADFTRVGDWYLHPYIQPNSINGIANVITQVPIDSIDGKNIFNVFSSAINDAKKNNNERILFNCFKALTYYSSNKLHSIAYSFLGKYFEQANDSQTLKVSLANYYASLLSQLVIRPESYTNVINTLTSISIQLARTGNVSDAMFYCDKAMEISYVLNDTFLISLMHTNKANVLNHLGKYQEALNVLNSLNAIAINLPELYNSYIKTDWLRQKYYIHSNLYQVDSAEMYSSMYFQDRTRLLNELSELNKVEQSIDEQDYNESINTKNLEIRQKNEVIKLREKHLTELFSKIIQTQKQLEQKALLIRLKDSTIQTKELLLSKLDDSLSNRRKEVVELAKTKQQLTNEIVGILFLATGLIAAILIYLVQYRKRKNEQVRLVNEQLEITKDVLEGNAKIRIHNAKSNYQTILSLINEKQFSRLNLYAQSYAKYLKKSLNTWSKVETTLDDELKLLNYFYSASEQINMHISLTTSVDKDVDEWTTLFPTEVFTTLFDNSVKHGFKEKEGDLCIDIVVQKKGNNLYVTFEDNGIGQPESEFFSNTNQNHGLAILKKRIMTMQRIVGVKDSQIIPLKVSSSKFTGTKIEFIYPYGKIKSLNS